MPEEHAAIRPTRWAAELRQAMLGYVAWATHYPARFKLVFGAWSIDSPELSVAANTAQATLASLVSAAQRANVLPAGDSVRLAALLRALAHGAADLAAAGHLSSAGKGHADPDGLVDDLIGYLRDATRAARR